MLDLATADVRVGRQSRLREYRRTETRVKARRFDERSIGGPGNGPRPAAPWRRLGNAPQAQLG
jgi:hypothetical protein